MATFHSNKDVLSHDDYLGQVPFVIGNSLHQLINQETLVAIALTLFLTTSEGQHPLSPWGQEALRASVSSRLQSA